MSRQNYSRHIHILALTIWLAYSWAAHAGSAIKTEHTEIRLLSEQQRICEGNSFWFALQLTPENSWHTYWKNPGDAGKATAIKWKLPPGLQAGPLHWPHPQRIRTGPLVSFGYTGTVNLLTEISGDLQLDIDKIDISATADWLVCEDICIPESADLTLSLPIGAQCEKDKATVSVFQVTREQLPKRASWTAHYIYKDEQLVFDAPLEAPAGLESVLFFPVEDNLIENSSNQSFILGKNALRVSVGAGYSQQSGPFHGVLVLKRSAGGVAEAMEFTAHPVKELPDLYLDVKPGSHP